MVGHGAVAELVPPARLQALPAVRIPSVAQCLAMILVVKLCLRSFGFNRVIIFLRNRLGTVPVVPLADPTLVRAAERVVAMAGALYPGRALCLEQSLLLYYVLRRQGIAVAYCQGVMPCPFQAHAWIEFEGEVVNDVAEHARQFARLPLQLP